MQSSQTDFLPREDNKTEGESSSSKSEGANEPLQPTLAAGPPSAGSRKCEGGERGTASIESNRQLAEEIEIDKKRNAESVQLQTSATANKKMKKPSVEGEEAGESARKRSRVEHLPTAVHIQQDTEAPEIQRPGIQYESTPAATSPAPLVAPEQNVVFFNPAPEMQTEHIKQQPASSLTSLPRLPLSMQTALLSSAAASVGPVHPVQQPPRLSPEMQTAHLHQQHAYSLSALSQLPLSVQNALLSSAAASVGPVHPFQPPQLASLLALQRATRLAATDQLMASNPFARQIFLQRLLGGSAGIAPPALPLVGNFGPIYPPWAGLHNGMPALPPFALQGPGVPAVSVNTDGLPPGTSIGQNTTPSPAPISYHGNHGGPAGERISDSSGSSLQQSYTVDSIGPEVPESLPAVLALPEDDTKLSAYQILLRNQIEAFSATSDDLATHARGRNKPINLGQVGIRCRHCKHVALNRRKKGSVYFPFSLLGLYQAAQNMGSSHFHDGESCNEMSTELKEKFVESIACKSTVGSGKQYWAMSAGKLGLVDTYHGIRFIRDLVAAGSDSNNSS